MAAEQKYDLVIIGSGPAGQQAALEASRRGMRTAVVERQQLLGGVCLHTGTMPSKAFREAVLQFTGWYNRACGHGPFSLHDGDWMLRLKSHVNRVIEQELKVIGDYFSHRGIDLHQGSAAFVDPHRLAVTAPNGARFRLHGRWILVATGSAPQRPPLFPFDGQTVIDSDELYTLNRLPGNLVIVGGGVIALEYASIFALLGIPVQVVAQGTSILPFLDTDIVRILQSELEGLGVRFHLGRRIACAGSGPRVELEDGTVVRGELVLVAAGRLGLTQGLELANAGLSADDRNLLRVDASWRTQVPHIAAAGDIVGFPATASSAKVQGFQAVHAMACPGCAPVSLEPVPFGIYTIPEIAYAGLSEQQVRASGTEPLTGTARFSQLSRGEILGDASGILKLVFRRKDQVLAGVHIIGTSSAELVQFGQEALRVGATPAWFTERVFNYPTLMEAYKLAAIDAETNLLPS